LTKTFPNARRVASSNIPTNQNLKHKRKQARRIVRCEQTRKSNFEKQKRNAAAFLFCVVIAPQ
jgi:hypothetical protein